MAVSPGTGCSGIDPSGGRRILNCQRAESGADHANRIIIITLLVKINTNVNLFNEPGRQCGLIRGGKVDRGVEGRSAVRRVRDLCGTPTRGTPQAQSAGADFYIAIPERNSRCIGITGTVTACGANRVHWRACVLLSEYPAGGGDSCIPRLYIISITSRRA